MTSRSCTRKRDEQRCVGSLDEGVRETSGEMLRSRNSKVPDTRQFFPSLSSLSLPLPRHLFRRVLNTFTPTSLLPLCSAFWVISLIPSACLQTRVNSAEYMTSSRNLVMPTKGRRDDGKTTTGLPVSLGGSCLLLLPLADRSKSDPLLLSFSHVSRVFDSNRYHAS